MGRSGKNRGKVISQAAVLAVRNGRICLITSSSGKRWLLPKGHREHGYKFRETAREEAWEEAGLIGRIGARPVGAYEYEKLGQFYRVVIYWITYSGSGLSANAAAAAGSVPTRPCLISAIPHFAKSSMRPFIAAARLSTGLAVNIENAVYP